ncbi:Protein NETWORKED 2B [Linum perenne]
MLQRAASNAYSWWWASHIRTKQSKWLEENLQDMEDKVGQMLSIIENEGDSFTKRVEMYYKQRPELINHVEDSYRAYRALAERFDHLSKDLQSANRTIATVFPDSVQFSDDFYSDDGSFTPPRISSDSEGGGTFTPPPPRSKKILKKQSTFHGHNQKPSSGGSAAFLSRSITSYPPPDLGSGMSKEEALDEIDKLQKEILSLQTEKEFVVSIRDRCNSKCDKIEEKVVEIQDRIHKLQDEFDISNVLDDGEARGLMAATALKSCKDALVNLQSKQDQSIEDVNLEQEKIDAVQRKFSHLKVELMKKLDVIQEEEGKEDKVEEEKYEETKDEEDRDAEEEKYEETKDEEDKDAEDKVEEVKDEKIEKEVKESQSVGTVMQLADKIDQLVEKVAHLETEVSSQGAMVRTLKSDTSSLEIRVSRLEEEKEALKHNSGTVNSRLKELEEELNRVKLLNRNIQDHNNTLKADLAEANSKIEHLNDRLKTVELRDEQSLDKKKPEQEGQECKTSSRDGKKELTSITLEGDSDGKEKIMAEDYSTVLTNYKDVRRKLGDVEKKSQDGFFELSLQIRELKNALETRDEEIQSLKKTGNYSPDERGTDVKVSPESIANIGGYPQSDPPSYYSPNPQHPGFKGSVASNPKQGESPRPVSVVEQKIRSEIDNLLEDNLEFWLRFSTSFHQIRKFQNSVQDLKGELSNVMDNRRVDGTGKLIPSLIQDARPIHKHLKEIQNEVTIWLENNTVLKDELNVRSKSLSGIEDELTQVYNTEAEAKEKELSDYQAAKFQGELINMKQEGSKVEEELHMGLDRVKGLKSEIERIVSQLDGEIAVISRQRSVSKPRIPLRSFLFGVKLKKKTSMFSCVSPQLDRQFSDVPPRPLD